MAFFCNTYQELDPIVATFSLQALSALHELPEYNIEIMSIMRNRRCGQRKQSFVEDEVTLLTQARLSAQNYQSMHSV